MCKPEFGTTTSTTRCETCDERSTWEFLRDFYSKVESANEYAQRMENERQEAMNLVQQSQHALFQCEACLDTSWELLSGERLEHRASQEALIFERERHKDTIAMLERVFEEAMRAGEIADRLVSKLAELEAASGSGVGHVAPQVTVSTQTILTPPEAPTSTSQQSELTEPLPGIHTSSPGLKQPSPNEQTIQIPRADTSYQLQSGDSLPTRAQTLPLIESKSSTSGATGGKAPGSRRKRTRRIAKKGTGLEVSQESPLS